MKILIIEDELPAQRLMMRFIGELLPQAQIVSALGSVKESVDWLQNNPHPDIIFMDVYQFIYPNTGIVKAHKYCFIPYLRR